MLWSCVWLNAFNDSKSWEHLIFLFSLNFFKNIFFPSVTSGILIILLYTIKSIQFMVENLPEIEVALYIILKYYKTISRVNYGKNDFNSIAPSVFQGTLFFLSNCGSQTALISAGLTGKACFSFMAFCFLTSLFTGFVIILQELTVLPPNT